MKAAEIVVIILEPALYGVYAAVVGAELITSKCGIKLNCAFKGSKICLMSAYSNAMNDGRQTPPPSYQQACAMNRPLVCSAEGTSEPSIAAIIQPKKQSSVQRGQESECCCRDWCIIMSCFCAFCCCIDEHKRDKR